MKSFIRKCNSKKFYPQHQVTQFEDVYYLSSTTILFYLKMSTIYNDPPPLYRLIYPQDETNLVTQYVEINSKCRKNSEITLINSPS